MIWGGILQGGFKYNTGIANFFIQCAEDNALCTLKSLVEKHELKCKKVSWYAFQFKNKCKKNECKDNDCKHDKCKGKDFKCHSIEHKDLCVFCKHTFRVRVIEALGIDKQNIHIEDESVGSDTDEDEEDSSYRILSYNNFF